MSDFERFFAKHPTNDVRRVFGEFDFLHNVYNDYSSRLVKLPKIGGEKLCVLTLSGFCRIISRYEKKN